jgi:subtilase family serine protease
VARRRLSSSSQPARFLEPLESRNLFSAVAHPHVHTFHSKHVGHNLPAATTDLTVVPDVTNTVATGKTPTQIAHAYGFDKIAFSNGAVKGSGAGQTIAIVDAYDDPNIASDLATFSAKFNLPQMNSAGAPVFSELKATGVTADAGWAMETALDVEWAHAIAPQANIVLIEAKTASLTDLLGAVNAARLQTKASVVSMSWGSNEFSSEAGYDSYFTTPSGHTPMTFVASSGDTGAPASWPAISSNVLSVGGTSLTLDSAGNYLSESAWSGSGGGGSYYIPRPSYQNRVIASGSRVDPDVAYNADPNTGYAVYNSVTQSNGQSGWFQMGGTSAAAPQWAALLAVANQGRATIGKTTLNGRSQVLPALYNAPSTDFHDITSGASRGTITYAAAPGYDVATGLGTPKADLITNLFVNT